MVIDFWIQTIDFGSLAFGEGSVRCLNQVSQRLDVLYRPKLTALRV